MCYSTFYYRRIGELTLDEYKEKIKLVKDSVENIEIIPGLEIYIDPELPRLYKEHKIWGYNYKKYFTN